jgi:hypothetical protein
VKVYIEGCEANLITVRIGQLYIFLHVMLISNAIRTEIGMRSEVHISLTYTVFV